MQSRRKINIEQHSTQSTESTKGSNGRNNKSNNIISNNYQRVDKQKESNTPYKIIINTRYDKCRKPQDDKINKSKEETKSQTHIHMLTREERQKYGRGIRPIAAQREFDAYAKLDNKTKDSMIEIIDKTKYPLENNNIKLKPNKVTLINKKKIVVQNDPRQKYSRGIREKKEEIIGEIEVNEEPSRIRNTNNNQNQNKEVKLISNKRTVIRNKKPLSPLPGNRGGNPPINYDPKKNLTKKVEKTTTRNIINSPDTNTANKNNFRHNTVSHKIVDIKKGERKPYVLNERKTDIISFRPNAFRKYSFSNNWNKEPLKSDKNHSIITTRNVTREYKTVADLPPNQKVHHKYNISHDPNLKNTGSHKIDATKKETKKEVVVHPRKLTVIRSVIPSRRHSTETNNENSGQKKNQNLFVRKYESDKKTPHNLDKKFEMVRENKYNLQKPQTQQNLNQPKPKIENKTNPKDIINTRITRRINNNEQKKETPKTTNTTNTINTTNTNRYSKPSTIIKSQTTQHTPSTQSTRIKRDYQKPLEKSIEKPSENKNQPKMNTYTPKYPIKAPQVQPQQTKQSQPTYVKPTVQTNKYTISYTIDTSKYSRKKQPYQISSQHGISSNNNTYSQPINQRQEKNLDNNDVKQIIYKKNSNTSNNTNNDKTKNYVVSNIGFVQNKNNNGFVISRANKSTNSTAINYNVNKNENKENKGIKGNEINKENKNIKNEEIITKIDVKIEPKVEEHQEQKEETLEKEQEQEQKEEPEEQEVVEVENENIQNNENIEDNEEIIKIESPVEQNVEKQENINEYNINQNEQQKTENINIVDTNVPKEEILSDENPNVNIEININKEEQNNEEINPEYNEEENNEINQQVNIEEREQEPGKEQIEQNENLISNEYEQNINMDINNIQNEEGGEEEGGEEGEEQIENVEVYENEDGNYQQQNEGEGEEEQIENENGEEYVNMNVNENGEEYVNMNVNENENGEEYININENENGEEYQNNINENGEEYENNIIENGEEYENNINANGEEYVNMNEEEENGEENYEEEVGGEEIQEIDGGEEEEVEGGEEVEEEVEGDNKEQ